ncbi:Glutamine-rich protein 2 [Frankliniella fusca]|uniref:Glutamine-rich protein 2 n=1 Tax=Frankliniella fusca TaxID=407009 RepID=A0AAE1I051_9NEOP|nr:Glutamine-rich protein 2 [Frankliniella fusca]
MTSAAVSLSLPQMVDLALGSPEVGSVNFNILHSLLHVMIQQLELQQCAVEFRGPDSERIQAAIAGSAVPAARLSEYRVRDRSRRDKEIAKHAAREAHPHPHSPTETSDLDEDRRARPRTRAARDLPSSASSSSTSVSDGLSQGLGQGLGAAATKAKQGRKGRRRLLGLEEAEEVMRHSRRRRFSAHLLEVLASSHRLGRLSEDASQVRVVQAEDPDAPKREPADLEQRTKAVECEIAKLTAQGEDAFRRLRLLEASLEASLEDALEVLPLGHKPRRRASRDRDRDTATTERDLSSSLLKDECLLHALKSKMALLTPAAGPGGPMGFSLAAPALPDRGGLGLEPLEAELAEHGRSLGALQSDLRQLAARLDGLDALARGLSAGLDKGIGALDRRLQGMQEDIDSTASHVGTLFRDRDQRARVVQGLQSQVQALEKHKADRWQLEAALAEKADRGLVSAKVSHTEFTAACTNIHHDLGQAKSKLHETESRLDAKLDRTELPAVAAELAEHVERLVAERPGEQARQQQQQLAHQAHALQAEHFAAATKVRLIRNVTCISCDGPRTMRCDDWCPAVPTCDSFPDRRPTRPHLGGQPCQAPPPRSINLSNIHTL